MKRNENGSYLIDEKDRRLLSILQENASVSLSQLGREVNLSKMAVSNRVKRLKDLGIIEGSFFKINPEKIGQDYIVISRITCRVRGVEQEKIASAIAQMPGVMSVYLIFGSSDILFIARRKDRKSAKQLIYDVSKVPGVGRTMTMVPHTVIKESLAIDTEA
jgi:DNA-binding Lrp family transcriptional regulator